MEILYKVFGAIGLILITAGVVIKDRKKQNLAFIFGGIFLLSYSISIKDPIFIPLQIIFTLVAVRELMQHRKKK